MSKLNLFSSYEDEMLKIAIDKEWIKISGDPNVIHHQLEDRAPTDKELVGHIQKMLGVSVDNIWGPETANAWNSYMKSLPQPWSSLGVNQNGTQPPSAETIRSVLMGINGNQQSVNVDLNKFVPGPNPVSTGNPRPEHIAFQADDIGRLSQTQKEFVTKVMKAKALNFEDAMFEAQRLAPNMFKPVQTPVKQPIAPKAPVDVYEDMAKSFDQPVVTPDGDEILKNIDQKMQNWNKKPLNVINIPEHVPGSLKPDTNLLYNNASSIIKELVVLANDLDAMGEKQAANSIDKEIMLYKQSMDRLYDVTGETGEQFINKVHGPGPVITPSKDQGAKVENIFEQQQADLEVVKKQPTGKLASFINRLVVTANRLDESGDYEGAKIVDKAILELSKKVLPFADRNIALGAACSYDFKASVKNAQNKKNADLIPIWDNIIYQYWNSLYDQMTSSKIFGENGADIYFRANNIKNNIAKKWHTLDNKSLSEMILEMANVLSLLKVENKDYLWNKYAVDHKTLIKSLIELSSKISSFRNQEVSSLFLNKYVGTLNKLLKALINPVNPNVLYNVLGGNNRSIGMQKYKELIQQLQKEIENAPRIYRGEKGDAQAGIENDNVWNNIINPLTAWKAIVVAGRNFSNRVVKTGAINVSIPLPPSAKKPVQPAQKKVKTPGNRSMSNGVDENIKRLQKALMNAGFDVGPTNDDGKWGRNTISAWDRFVSKVEQLSGGRETRLTKNLDMKNKPTAGEIEKAIRWSDYMSKRTSDTLSVIEFQVGDKKFNSNDLKSTDACLSALARESFLVDDYFKIDKKQLLPIVSKSLKEMLNSFDGEQGVYLKNTYGEEVVQNLQRMIYKLWGDFNQPQQGMGMANQGNQNAGQTPGQQSNKSWEPPKDLEAERVMKSIYSFNLESFMDADRFRRKSLAQGVSPEKQLRNISKQIGELDNALDKAQENIRRRYGDESYKKAGEYIAKLNNAIDSLGAEFGINLFEEKKSTRNATNVVYKNRETDRPNPYLKEYTHPLTGEKVVLDSRVKGNQFLF